MIPLPQVLRIDLGYFVRPAEETSTGRPQVEPLLAYLVQLPEGCLLFDTGIGGGDPDLERHYRPQRRRLGSALAGCGIHLEDVRWVSNCHLHFDHSGGNPELRGRPIFVQRIELERARSDPGYTLPELVDRELDYRALNGLEEILPGVLLIPTPGHVEGHQALAVRCPQGTVVCAGQSHDNAFLFGADMLALEARRDGLAEPLPEPPAWLRTLAELDPSWVVFAHDASVWVPGQWTPRTAG